MADCINQRGFDTIRPKMEGFLPFFGTDSCVADCCCWRFFFKRVDGFSFLKASFDFFAKTICTSTTKQHNCRFLVFQRSVRNSSASFASKIFVTFLNSFSIFGSGYTFVVNNIFQGKIHLQYHLERTFVSRKV